MGRIVEVEAYIGPNDRASHARFGRTSRTELMFGEPGRAYLYLVYGMHVCLNVVTEPVDQPAAVLIRAVELIEGVELARAARLERMLANHRRRPDPVQQAAIEARLARTATHRLAAGPGLVGAAFGLRVDAGGTDLCDPASSLRLERRPAGEPAPTIGSGPRIGIGHAGEPWLDRPWRLFDTSSPAVSGHPLPPGLRAPSGRPTLSGRPAPSGRPGLP